MPRNSDSLFTSYACHSVATDVLMHLFACNDHQKHVLVVMHQLMPKLVLHVMPQLKQNLVHSKVANAIQLSSSRDAELWRILKRIACTCVQSPY